MLVHICVCHIKLYSVTSKTKDMMELVHEFYLMSSVTYWHQYSVLFQNNGVLGSTMVVCETPSGVDNWSYRLYNIYTTTANNVHILTSSRSLACSKSFEAIPSDTHRVNMYVLIHSPFTHWMIQWIDRSTVNYICTLAVVQELTSLFLKIKANQMKDATRIHATGFNFPKSISFFLSLKSIRLHNRIHSVNR